MNVSGQWYNYGSFVTAIFHAEFVEQAEHFAPSCSQDSISTIIQAEL
jgi:hypothetical protein